MQDGIGRTGFRMLASVFLILGFLGIGMTWYGASGSITALTNVGLVIGVVSPLVLFAMLLFIDPPALVQETSLEGGETSMDGSQHPTMHAADTHDFEYDDYQPAPKAAPEELILPSAFEQEEPVNTDQPMQFQEKDPAAWPGKRGQSTWSVENEARRLAQERAESKPQRPDMAKKFTGRTPMVREILTGGPSSQVASRPKVTRQHKPTETAASTAAGAKQTPTDQAGKTRGKCGKCGSTLLAPNKRPLRLKCPVCDHVALLE